jgi:hypothetical protein
MERRPGGTELLPKGRAAPAQLDGCCLQRREPRMPRMELRVERVHAEQRLVDAGIELRDRDRGAARRRSGIRQRCRRSRQHEHGTDSSEPCRA